MLSPKFIVYMCSARTVCCFSEYDVVVSGLSVWNSKSLLDCSVLLHDLLMLIGTFGTQGYQSVDFLHDLHTFIIKILPVM